MEKKSFTGKELFFICIFTVLLLFVISPDSYTHDLFGRTDSGMFFLCGKAWMNGMIPYTDFSDSKGPLLFLIYGIGYLMSHLDYTGVFWLSCATYTVVFYFTFRISKLFVNSSRLSCLITVLMSASYFNPLFHYEVRCEDFAQLFIVPALYYTVKLLYLNRSEDIGKSAIVVGIAFGGTFLMKFNIAAMIVVFILYQFYFALKNKLFWKSVVGVCLGSTIIMLPFVVYFALMGGVENFIYEYIFEVFVTVKGTGPQVPIIRKISEFLFNPIHFQLLIVSLICTLFFDKNYSHRYKGFASIAFLWFYFVTLLNGAWHYYYSVCAVFIIFGLIVLSKLKIAKFFLRSGFMICLSLLVFIFVSAANIFRNFHTPGLQNLFFQNNELRKDYYSFCGVISMVEKPKIIYFTSMQGWDVPTDGLPGCKYSMPLTGSNKEFMQSKINSIKRYKTDFVGVSKNDKKVIFLLKKNNYARCYETSDKELYAKRKLSRRTHPIIPSNKEVLFKINPFTRKSFFQNKENTNL